MAYRIVTTTGKGIESHHTLREAERAYWTLTAHELRNDTGVEYEIEGFAGTLTSPTQFDLSDWVRKELKAAGLWK